MRHRCRAGRLVDLFTALVAVLVASHGAEAGPAVGQFELKDLDNDPGRVELQSQNAHSWGQPRRRSALDDGGERLYDDNSIARQRHALEVEMTLTHFFRMRIGIEYEKERIEEPGALAEANAFGELSLDEVALEGVFILLPVPKAGGAGIGFVAEFEHPLEGGDLNSIVLGPLFEVRSGRWSGIANITAVKAFGNGEWEAGAFERDQKWDLAYALQAKYEFDDTWALAAEGYGTFDRVWDSGTPGESARRFGDHDQHRAGPILYYARRLDAGRTVSPAGESAEAEEAADIADDGEEDEGTVLTIGTGLLFGLNGNTPDATLKWSLELEF
ncbi:MAG: hypothetical protein NW205_02220 [Hyphomicrobiaceae bacterium]|nr:hypothetical protein [Hyphomicrobiaceae bacterium]